MADDQLTPDQTGKVFQFQVVIHMAFFVW